MLGGLVNHHIASVKEKTIFNGLRGTTAACPGIPSACVADALVMHGVVIHGGDLVMREGVVGEVHTCAREGSCFFVIVKALVRLENITPHCSAWRFESCDLLVWPASELVQVVAWRVEDDGRVLIVHEW